MSLLYKTVGLTTKLQLSEKDTTVSQVVDVLRQSGVTVCADHEHIGDLASTRHLADANSCKLDAMVVIGGDGTILRAVHSLREMHTPIISINRGTVGFLAELTMDEIEAELPKLLTGEGVEEQRMVFAVTVLRDGKEVSSTYALNEAVISQGTIARLLDLRTTVHDEYLASFHADGLIIATPTGSTAYSLAAGGPIVHPTQSAVIVTPINSHSLTQKPIILPGDSVVRVVPITHTTGKHPVSISLTVDGQSYIELQPHDEVCVQLHSQSAVFVRKKQSTFFHTLRTKLRWGEGV